VQRGDTLSQIARKYRQDTQSLVRWNNLSNPNSLQVGQVLRVEPPGRAGAGRDAVTTRDANGTPTSGAASSAAAAGAQAERDAESTPPVNAIALLWPARGTIIRGFDGANSKGIDIAGTAGDPVIAAAAGNVVYAGNGLRGYGNLLIIKHSNDFLTAYAHNRALLVKEGQQVGRGQQIAEMGDTDNDRVMLHFELRYHGRSIDPARYLPAH
jgi:lipoprotein YgeR